MERNRTNRWYNAAIVVCAVLLLFIMYRRSARTQATIEQMEERIEVLESYVRGSAERRVAVAERGVKSVERGVKSAERGVSDETPKHTEAKTYGKGKTATKAAGSPQEGIHTEPTAHVSMPEAETECEVRESKNEGKRENVKENWEKGVGKFKTPVRIELNTADSLTLVRVPGIGEGTAHLILKWRAKYGGFYSTNQLREFIKWEGAENYMEDWCETWFWTDEQFVQKLRINDVSFKTLVNHPYLSYDQVKAIMNWKNRHKTLKSMADMEQTGAFAPEELEALSHYVSF